MCCCRAVLLLRRGYGGAVIGGAGTASTRVSDSSKTC